MFNNIAFNTTTIQTMQPSMVYLYKIASEKRQVKTPAAVGRVLSVSQQRLKNWEIRGISKEGALMAQSVFQIDSNQLLAMNTPVDETEATPASPKKPPKTAPPAQVHQTRPIYYRTEWPFHKVSEKQWASLTPAQKSAVEGVIIGYLDTDDPPLHYEPPAQNSATG